MHELVSCPHCSSPVPKAKKGPARKFCSEKCRYTHWVTHNRDRLNRVTRDYRARRYEKEGRWRDEGPKAAALKDWMIEIKSKPCTDCGGIFEVCCMDFDHQDGTIKEYNIGSMFAHHYSRDLIEQELSKCELVCSNCHRIRTRDRRTGKRLPPRKDKAKTIERKRECR